MHVHVDNGQIPPVVQLREPDDFTSFSVVVSTPPHVWISPDVLAELAGRTDDQGWRAKLAGMVGYAASKGWVDAKGCVRAHVTLQAGDDGA